MAQLSITSINPPNIIDFCKIELDALLAAQPAFARVIEDEDPHACSREQLLDAMRCAPSTALRQHLFSVFQYRSMLATITEEAF